MLHQWRKGHDELVMFKRTSKIISSKGEERYVDDKQDIVTDLETICIQHTDVPKVSYVIKYVCSQIPFLLFSGRIKGMRCDLF